MSNKFHLVLPLVMSVGLIQAANASDDSNPQSLAQIQSECASFVSQSGATGSLSEQMQWICESSLRDYDNSED
ncbi:MAG: hypothetical protein HUJ29_08115 [Gammaproteobacteria bacterium]|nr:hypothetical protein [Gammaproteobacteria bacterium]